MMTKVGWVVVFVWLMVMTVCQFDDWGDRGRRDVRMDEIVSESEEVLDRVVQMGIVGAVRDSVLMEGVRVSVGRLDELSRLREMSNREARLLGDSIVMDRVRIDSMSKGMLDW